MAARRVRRTGGPYRLMLVGFGTVGRDLARLLAGNPAWRELFPVVAVVTARHGRAVDPRGLDLETLLRRAADDLCLAGGGRATPAQLPAVVDLIRLTPADIVVELTPLSIADGRPAIDHVEAAVTSGKHVVTANKGPIAHDYHRLAGLARDAGRRLLFESAVMDGTPVFSLARYGLSGCRVLGFRGILNSTTNFVLQAMERAACGGGAACNGGVAGDSGAAVATAGSLDAAVAEAVRLGFAEADPSLDLDGWDAAAKVAALANVLMDARVTPADVQRTGIRDITPTRIRDAAVRGGRIKLICTAAARVGRTLSVAPAFVPLSDPFALVEGASSILTLSTDLMGEITLIEHDPRATQTAYGVLNDLLEIARPQIARMEGEKPDHEAS